MLVLAMQVFGLKLLKKSDLTYRVIDRMLGAQARTIARRSGAELFLYSQYAFEAFSDPKLADRQRILFTFHPHRRLIRDVLRADSQAFPELNWTIREGDPSPRSEEREDQELGLAQLVLCASSFTKRSIEYSGICSAPILVVPYGAPAVHITSPRSRQKTGCRFLFVGQGVQRKGIHLLLKAWNHLSLPGATLTVVCYRIDLAVRGLLNDNIDFRPGVSKNELDALFETSDVFVMPSLIEGFGLVFLEALARGCFVIGSENTGLADLQLPPSAADVIRAGDVDSLVNAMEAAYLMKQQDGIPYQEIRHLARSASWERFRRGIRSAIQSASNSDPSGLTEVESQVCQSLSR